MAQYDQIIKERSSTEGLMGWDLSSPDALLVGAKEPEGEGDESQGGRGR